MTDDRVPATDAEVATLLALLRVHARGRATVRLVADELGVATSTAHVHLRRLARLGLVAGAGEGRARYVPLRPLVQVVPTDLARRRLHAGQRADRAARRHRTTD